MFLKDLVNYKSIETMKISEVLNCSFSAWYPQFKEYTIKSQIIPLPQEFVDYLLADQVVLPESSVALSAAHQDEDEDDNRYADNVVDWATEDIMTPVAEPPSFPEFESLLKIAIRRMGGKVFPKLNWSAPRDASWISFDRTLKCTCPSDVYLLLKSSDFISHDLTEPFKFCTDDENLKNETTVKYELVLRKWRELNPAYEFRCFVKGNTVIGISQRHTDMYYKFIPENRKEIEGDIQAFFYHIIKDNFPDKSYCFDVYRRCQGKLVLLDINPFGEVTDGLLYTWEELLTDKPSHTEEEGEVDEITDPLLRCVESETGVQSNPYGAYAVPKDFVDIAHGEDPTKLMQLLQLKVSQQTNHPDSSSDEEPESALGS
ncbi:cell division cycle protein 123 homolog isoform X2 [Mya arenaria]|uniref:cell division cycle protein 123 homolog isoform X2 n=1 Tax=Mya arenaria TaxID=6604 RepID=UPI0022E1E3DD|nr:cell division cycle protein 123 homolog isoform X2 [Mya arenaria]